jgi:GNAT superfamily N-acetyltransferase
LRRFITFPYRLHRQHPQWIAPLRLEQKKIFNPAKNKFLQHCEYALFLLLEGKRVIGRIAAFVNHVANEYWQEQIGFFGHYECIDDRDAALLLLKKAEDWLRDRKMRTMRGPWNFVSQDFGLIVEGYELAPTVLSSWNPLYYNKQLLQFGLNKARDMLVYSCDISRGYLIPQRFVDFTERIAERYRVRIRPLDMKNLLRDARTIVRLTNISLSRNWGFYPIAEEEAEDIAADLKPIVHPEAVLIAEIDGKPIGYILAIPDVNHLLKKSHGRLGPLTLLRLLVGIKSLNRYRIWAMGIVPEYQKKGISILLFKRLNEVLAPRRVYVEANWVLEDNALMNNALRQLQFDLVKRYRVYEKKLIN